MAIKNSGSSLAFSEIEAEFGQNGGRSLGAYRLTQSVGSLSNLPLDSGIPTTGQIKFSDFYGKKLNVVVDCHSGGREDRKSAKGDKWNNNAVTVIGGFRTKKEGGSKIIINVNKKFCSDKSNQINCALKTGSWDSTATVQVDVGSSGEVLGAGGDGGRGADGINNNGQPGSPGTSALGIEHNGVTVNIASGGILRCGFGGGGGGGRHAAVACACAATPTNEGLDGSRRVHSRAACIGQPDATMLRHGPVPAARGVLAAVGEPAFPQSGPDLGRLGGLAELGDAGAYD